MYQLEEVSTGAFRAKRVRTRTEAMALFEAFWLEQQNANKPSLGELRSAKFYSKFNGQGWSMFVTSNHRPNSGSFDIMLMDGTTVKAVLGMKHFFNGLEDKMYRAKICPIHHPELSRIQEYVYANLSSSVRVTPKPIMVGDLSRVRTVVRLKTKNGHGAMEVAVEEVDGYDGICGEYALQVDEVLYISTYPRDINNHVFGKVRIKRHFQHMFGVEADVEL